MRIRIAIVLLALFPILSVAQLRAAELVDPAPIPIPQGVSQADAKEAVIDAMYSRGWAVAEESDEHVLADLHIRRHWAQVYIAIGEDSIEITYSDSDNLNFRERGERTVIHRNYLGWIDNLVGDIRRNLARQRRSN